MTNEERASFVTQAYCYLTKVDTAIQAKFPKAQPVAVETNLDQAGAGAYRDSIFARLSLYTETYTVEIEGVYRTDDFSAQPLRYNLAHPRYPSLDSTVPRTAVGVQIDYANGRTTLTVMG